MNEQTNRAKASSVSITVHPPQWSTCDVHGCELLSTKSLPNDTTDEVIQCRISCICFSLAVHIFLVRARRYGNSLHQINPFIQSLTLPTFESNWTIWTPRWSPAPAAIIIADWNNVNSGRALVYTCRVMMRWPAAGVLGEAWSRSSGSAGCPAGLWKGWASRGRCRHPNWNALSKWRETTTQQWLERKKHQKTMNLKNNNNNEEKNWTDLHCGDHLLLSTFSASWHVGHIAGISRHIRLVLFSK